MLIGYCINSISAYNFFVDDVCTYGPLKISCSGYEEIGSDVIERKLTVEKAEVRHSFFPRIILYINEHAREITIKTTKGALKLIIKGK